jgi:CRP-like cAMP-binding protein
VKEGEEGDAFYIITQGACQVTKRDKEGKEIVLTTLKEGDFFGEFAFFSNSVRQASVTVLKETEALKLSRKQLEEILAQFPRVKETLKEFYKERLIGTILAISPLFKPLPEEARKEILSAFQYKEVEAGTVLIRQGEEGKGLYVIISGEVAVSVRTKKSLKEVARLKEGEFFGEISLLTDSPTTANCIAVKETSLFFLPREKFVELILTYPQILEVTSSIADERMKVTKPLLLSGEALTQAGLV